MAHTKANSLVVIPAACRTGGAVASAPHPAPPRAWSRLVDWPAWCASTPVGGRSHELAAIQQELERRGVRYTMDADELLVDEHAERMVDMIVESITET